VLEATKAGLQKAKRDLQEKQGRELMVQQEAVKYKELCQEIINKNMQDMRELKEMVDQLLHE
jgi:Fe2+ transport system protein B